MLWTYGRCRQIGKHAAELAALAPDVILACGASTVGPLLQATRSVPIVFPVIVDPVSKAASALSISSASRTLTALTPPTGVADGCARAAARRSGCDVLECFLAEPRTPTMAMYSLY